MTELFRRIAAIIRTDILFRFRRTAAVVTLLLVAAAVYFIVPDVSTGRTLIQIDGRRVLYNSAAVALSTAMFCALFLSLIGYYLVSNSFRRDIVSRMGFIIAAAPISNTEYVVGKFFGNMLYLLAVMLACMLSAMVMFLIRGEGSLQPLVFLGIYSTLVIPSILFSSATALAFEALPVLSGRVGDVLYFFVWAAMLGLPASLVETASGPEWLRALDIIGFIPTIELLQKQFHTTTMSIGASSFNAVRPPILFPGVDWSWSLIGQRASTLVLPAIGLIGARTWFHRFNPTRIKSSFHHAKRNLLSRINVALKPVARFSQRFEFIGRKRTSLANAVWADAVATLALSPATTIAIVVFAILSLFIDASALLGGVIPAIVVALVIALADIATRDQSASMLNLLFTAPKLKAQYVIWKFMSALVVTLCFTLIPIVRLVFDNPSVALSLLVGSCFVAGGAIGLGVLARSQKLFIALYLMLLYIALNAPNVSSFDFAGFSARATTGVHAGYTLLTILLVLGAHIRYSVLVRRS
ncbi:MAG: hypothetical protein HY033_10415 [Ignavibacteriae bacterium]|nr:hypothetical protein [Ignavibacteria bacterium]MBI3365310.1 hypothetical protein [Ignavibacteriota bacterium]